MTYSPLTTLVIITALVVPLAYADDSLAIVTAESSIVTSLTRKEVADLFLGKHKINIGGQSVTPIDVTEEAPVRGLDQAAPRLCIIRTERSIVVGEIVKCREVELILKADCHGFDRLSVTLV